jgi:hypothetical protein
MAPRRVALLVAIVSALTSAAPAGASGGPVPGAALQGSYLLAGRVKVQGHIRGEHSGQSVLRTWRFQPGCPSGPCPTVTLTRPRAGGVDTVLLKQMQPGYYVGHGSYFAPLRCAGKIYRPGERVPFTITVTVTTAVTINGVLTAGRLYTTYANPIRFNLTPCVAVLGHDSASYHGHIVPTG